MGELFANFEAYDVQATRKEQQEEDICKMVKAFRDTIASKEIAMQQLMEKYNLDQEEAIEKVNMYW